jgi:catechol 2,3-dioxygenase-like lactoylglutathione lyase family enzyme
MTASAAHAHARSDPPVPLEPPCTRLLAADYAACFRFYATVLPKLTCAELAHGDESSGYASWDARGVTAFALLDRRFMSGPLGTAGLPAEPTESVQDRASLVFHLQDPAALDEAFALCAGAGAAVVAEAQDRPQWGATLRAAHLRDPDGNLLELQTY